MPNLRPHQVSLQTWFGLIAVYALAFFLLRLSIILGGAAICAVTFLAGMSILAGGKVTSGTLVVITMLALALMVSLALFNAILFAPK